MNVPTSLAAGLVTLMSVCAAVPVARANETGDRLAAASVMFEEIMQVPDKSVPRDLLARAECAILVPGVKKGAFIIGGKYGRGFVLCRKDDRSWSAPAGVRMEGGSVGFQIGGSETDVFMLVMNPRGADRLLSSSFTLGGDAAVAAGPLGRQTSAETDAAMRAEILSWSRSRGVFAGVSLQGATLRQDTSANEALYGKLLRTREIVRGSLRAPTAANALMEQLGRY